MNQPIRIATRKSKLALWQANHIKQQLENQFPLLKIELVGITTEGDKRLDITLDKVGGKGVFIKELEIALEEGRADLAVHSIKDMPAELPEKFVLAAITKRANPCDAFVANFYMNLECLPPQAVVGTSSLRRVCQLKAMRPDLNIKMLRGNIDTRLKKLDNSEFDAIILAVAGLERLTMQDRITKIIRPEQILPAAGQGALGIECLASNSFIIDLVKSLNDYTTEQCVLAERTFNYYLGGGCHTPVGAYACIEENQLYLRGLVGKPDGSLILRAEIRGDIKQAESLGKTLAEKLIQQGAKNIF